MKNKRITLGLLALLVLFCAYSCNKNDEPDNQFPPNTEVGANTFMFRVNEGEIINSQVGYLSAKPRIHVFYNHIDTFLNNNFLFQIDGHKVLLEDNINVGININYMPKTGIYALSEYAPAGKSNYAYYDNLSPTELHYCTDAGNSGELNITKLDTVNHIISGNFHFMASQWCLSGNCNGVVTVEGQFDVKYKPNEGVNYY